MACPPEHTWGPGVPRTRVYPRLAYLGPRYAQDRISPGTSPTCRGKGVLDGAYLGPGSPQDPGIPATWAHLARALALPGTSPGRLPGRLKDKSDPEFSKDLRPSGAQGRPGEPREQIRFEMYCRMQSKSTPEANYKACLWALCVCEDSRAGKTYCHLSSHFTFWFLAWTRNWPRKGLITGLRG